MSDVVSYELIDTIGIISVNNPPVNALAQGVRAGIDDSRRCLPWPCRRPLPQIARRGVRRRWSSGAPRDALLRRGVDP